MRTWVILVFQLLLLNLDLIEAGSGPSSSTATLHCDTSIIPPPPFVLFPQPLDHSVSDSAFFNQRVQTIDKYYRSGGPLLFYAGPENAANLWSLLCLSLMDWAKELGAGVVGAEHRYFGESVPDKSVGWEYLSLPNVLADYAAVIQNATGPSGRFEGAKTIVFGGSYGGFLSMMMRIKYPDLVNAGSVASAAPVSFFGGALNVTGLWFDTLVDIYESHDARCASNVSVAFSHIVDMLDAGKFASVAQQLGLCRSPTPDQVTEFLFYLQHAFSVISQFQFPFKAADKVPFPFTVVCESFTGSADFTDLMAAMKVALDVGYNVTGTMTCFWPASSVSSGSGSHISAANDISFAESWFVICCSYFVMPISGGQKSTDFFHFVHEFYFDSYSDYCSRKFGVRPQETPIFDPALLSTGNVI